MREIKRRNVNDLYVEGLWWLKTAGKLEQSRNGEVLVAPEPVLIGYRNPTERVLFDDLRDCNPFFHLYEAVWMLAGCNEVKLVAEFNKQMYEYADGPFIHGAYGHRWRHGFKFDQLHAVVKMLKTNPETRQAVLQMWDADSDLWGTWKDRPCNTHAYFRIRDNKLETTVCSRSGDLLWGVFGANAVHFSILHEFIANAIGREVGTLYHFINNFHIYTGAPRYNEIMKFPNLDQNPYPWDTPFPQLTTSRLWQLFLDECSIVATHNPGRNKVEHPWLRDLAVPMIDLWRTRDRAHLARMPECDWKVAFIRWLDRREHGKK